jgi:hypothetical protein
LIGPDDIAAFEEQNREALAQANEYARRVEKGLPPDRFVTGTKNAALVGRGIRAQQAMIGLFCEYIEALQRPSFDSTGVYDRHGNERN